FPCQMAQDHCFYSGARGYLPNILRAEMTFGHLPLDARLLLGCHDLPLPGPDQVLHSLLDGICLCDKQIGTFSQLDKAIEGTSITCENDDAARGVEAIGIRFVLTRSSPFVESEM